MSQQPKPKLMVQNISCILPQQSTLGGVFVGNVYGAQNPTILKQYGIRAVLTSSIQTQITYQASQIPFHLKINAHDQQTYNLRQHINKCIYFIEQSRKFTNVFIHCYAGVSRSVAIVCAYIMWKFKWNFQTTIAFMRAKRIVAKPNDGFVKQLMEIQSLLIETSYGNSNERDIKNSQGSSKSVTVTGYANGNSISNVNVKSNVTMAANMSINNRNAYHNNNNNHHITTNVNNLTNKPSTAIQNIYSSRKHNQQKNTTSQIQMQPSVYYNNTTSTNNHNKLTQSPVTPPHPYTSDKKRSISNNQIDKQKRYSDKNQQHQIFKQQNMNIKNSNESSNKFSLNQNEYNKIYQYQQRPSSYVTGNYNGNYNNVNNLYDVQANNLQMNNGGMGNNNNNNNNNNLKVPVGYVNNNNMANNSNNSEYYYNENIQKPKAMSRIDYSHHNSNNSNQVVAPMNYQYSPRVVGVNNTNNMNNTNNAHKNNSTNNTNNAHKNNSTNTASSLSNHSNNRISTSIQSIQMNKIQQNHQNQSQNHYQKPTKIELGRKKSPNSHNKIPIPKVVQNQHYRKQKQQKNNNSNYSTTNHSISSNNMNKTFSDKFTPQFSSSSFYTQQNISNNNNLSSTMTGFLGEKQYGERNIYNQKFDFRKIQGPQSTIKSNRDNQTYKTTSRCLVRPKDLPGYKNY